MNCFKCGRETPGEQYFCEECQVDMERYPVKPGTVVQLPPRREVPVARKASRKRTVSPEEQIRVMKKRLRIVTGLLILFLLLCVLMVYPLIQHAMEDHFAIGQNYSSITTTTAATDGSD